MANPVLNDKQWAKASGGSALPPPAASDRTLLGPDQTILPPPPPQPVTDGPSSPYAPYQPATATGDRMTMAGSLTATGVLLALVVLAGGVGWFLTATVPAAEAGGVETVSLPWWVYLTPFVALVLGLVITFKPHLARILAPIYALGYGMFLGAISKAFEVAYSGIVIQAVGATLGVALVMLVLYAARIVRVTQKLRSVIIGATLGIFVFYLGAMIVGLFTGGVPFLNSSSGFSIAFSFFVAGVAALNLLLDFDFIERASKAGAPKYMEWYAGFGVTVTIIWLYLEILRLLAKFRQ